MRRLLLLAALLSGASACESEDLLAELPDAGPPDAGACGAHVLYLNREPTAFTRGERSDSVDDVSSLLLVDSTTTTGAGLSDTQWQGLVTCMRGLFSAYDVTVTDVDPGPVDHLEIAVTGEPGDVGLENAGGLFSLVSTTCDEEGFLENPRDVAFAFARAYTDSNPDAFCVGGFASPAGMTLGLSPVEACGDVMADPQRCGIDGDRAFLDQESACVSRGCVQCDVQNSHQALLGRLGPSACGGGS